jgi:ABC-type antimicrobial peptide transport system permease subunit
MLRNYFKIAVRNLLKNKSFSFINILGLAVGMASAILIILWIQYEVTFDQFHEKKDRIYEAWNKDTFSGKLQCWNTTPKIFARTVEKEFPEVETVTRVDWGNTRLLRVGDKKLSSSGSAVDSNFLDVFTFPLQYGDPGTVLKDPYSIVLTQNLAKSLFNNENPMGKQVRIDEGDSYTVTGVLKEMPVNTRFKFDYLVPWNIVRKQGNDDPNWGNNSTRNYVLLKEHATLASIAPKLKYIKRNHDKDEPTNEMFLYPISRWRLYSSFTNGVEDGGLIDFVKMFAVIAAFILLIACINFMNLSTARSEKRAKEVGIRKVVGANKGSLVSQFLGESILIAFLAGILALLMVQLSLPAFSTLTNKKLFVEYSSPYFWLIFLGFIILTGIIAGSYPAFYLSAFKPVKVLKGTFQKSDKVITPRKILVVLQFTFAIILIICTAIVKEQIQHAQNRETGYNKDKLVYHFLTGDLDKHYAAVKDELIRSGVATSVTKTSAPLTQGWSDTWGIEWKGKAKDDKTDFDIYNADDGLATTAGLQVVQGRDFDLKQFPTDSTGMILNESAVKAMGFGNNAIGQIVKNNGTDWHVIGVIKDFILQSPYYPTKPMAIGGAKGWFNVIHFKLNGNNTTADNLKKAEAIFKSYNPQYPFEYKFIDEEYEAKFQSEKRTGTLAALFAGLTIFISCLGLFGLAAYMAEGRIKEIGVRKVLGASVTSIVSLLSKDFVGLVIISFLLASPIAWWFMHNWLKDYPYRVTIEWWIFVFAAGLSILIAMLTVSYHAIRAATANPVKSLRTE